MKERLNVLGSRLGWKDVNPVRATQQVKQAIQETEHRVEEIQGKIQFAHSTAMSMAVEYKRTKNTMMHANALRFLREKSGHENHLKSLFSRLSVLNSNLTSLEEASMQSGSPPSPPEDSKP